MEKKNSIQKEASFNYNRIAYCAFVLLAIYFLIAGNLESFCIQFGIALVFDPFNQSVVWKDRPSYQRVWMIVHLLILFVAFALMISGLAN